MSKLTNNDIATIKRQSDVISRNLRENFANIKNALNDNQDQINLISTSASNAETVAARPGVESRSQESTRTCKRDARCRSERTPERVTFTSGPCEYSIYLICTMAIHIVSTNTERKTTTSH